MLYRTVTWTIADEATVSDAIDMGSYELRGLMIPDLDSATLGFQASIDGPAGTFRTVKTNSSTPAALTLGDADTGDKFVAIPDEFARATPGTSIKLVAGSAQNGGPRSIVGLLVKVAP